MHATHVIYVRTPDGDRRFENPDGDPIARPHDEARRIAQQAADLAKRNGWRLAYFIAPIVVPSLDKRCGMCGASGFTYPAQAHDGTRGYGCMSCGAVKPEQVPK